jgi:RNA recognition motif-containing protein
MGNKIYVGNLPYSIDEKALEKLFSKFGEITDVKLITDKFSGRSKGFGFVTFTDDKSAKKAISEMNEKEVEGRAINVAEARPQRE